MDPKNDTTLKHEPTPENKNENNVEYVPLHGEPFQVVSHNCISTVDLSTTLDLITINAKTRNSEYNPQRFHGVVMRIREPRSTALIFKTGKIVTTGTRNGAEALLAAKKFTRILQKLGFDVGFNNYKLQSVVATCDLKFPIKLEEMSQLHGQFCRYEPEIFPGLIYRLIRPRLTMLIFVNGKIVFTGAKSMNDVVGALDVMYPILKSFKKR